MICSHGILHAPEALLPAPSKTQAHGMTTQSLAPKCPPPISALPAFPKSLHRALWNQKEDGSHSAAWRILPGLSCSLPRQLPLQGLSRFTVLCWPHFYAPCTTSPAQLTWIPITVPVLHKGRGLGTIPSGTTCNLQQPEGAQAAAHLNRASSSCFTTPTTGGP